MAQTDQTHSSSRRSPSTGALSGQIQNPDQASRPEDVTEALEKWDAHTREYAEAGGRPQSFDERRSALMKILPDSLGKDILTNVHFMDPGPGATQAQQDECYMTLRSMIQKNVELITQ